MYYQQQTTKLAGIGPMPIDPGPDLVCRMAARSFAQVNHEVPVEILKHIFQLLCQSRSVELTVSVRYCEWRAVVGAGARSVHEGPQKREEQRCSHDGVGANSRSCSLKRLLVQRDKV